MSPLCHRKVDLYHFLCICSVRGISVKRENLHSLIHLNDVKLTLCSGSSRHNLCKQQPQLTLKLFINKKNTSK